MTRQLEVIDDQIICTGTHFRFPCIIFDLTIMTPVRHETCFMSVFPLCDFERSTKTFGGGRVTFKNTIHCIKILIMY